MSCVTMNNVTKFSPQQSIPQLSATATPGNPAGGFTQPGGAAMMFAASTPKRGRNETSVNMTQPQHFTQYYNPSFTTAQVASPPSFSSQPPASVDTTDDQSPEPTISKRSRSNTYQAPREVKPSILTAMGSLVGGAQNGSNTSVPQRRRLSGGYLEDYIGSHDSMDTDTGADSRPRSMSF